MIIDNDKMERLFLTSSVSGVVKKIARQIGTKARGMRLAFIDTAAEVEEGDKWWLRDDRAALADVGFDVFDYTVTGKAAHNVRKDLARVDAIFVSGGNTFYLLQQLQRCNGLSIIRERITGGVLYMGSSAGSIIAGPDIEPVRTIDNAVKAPKLKDTKGLGLVDFVVFPHWGSDSFRKVYLQERLAHAYTTKHKIILLTDRQYIRVEGEMYRIEEVKK